MNATDNKMNARSKSGLLLESGAIDLDRLRSIVIAKATTKKGGGSFKASKLIDNVRAEVRSLLALPSKALVPEAINSAIIELCGGIAEVFIQREKAAGYEITSLSGQRTVSRLRDGEATVELHRTARMVRGLSLYDQLGAAKLELARYLDLDDKTSRGLGATGKPLPPATDVPARLAFLADKVGHWRAVISAIEADIAFAEKQLGK
jgi:hypothetical protein